MNISRREKILLLTVVYLLIACGGFKFLISPAQAKLAQAKAVNAQVDQALQQAIQKEKQNSHSPEVVIEELNRYLRLEEKLPKERNLVEIVEQIGDMAAAHEVDLLSVDYTESGENNKTSAASKVGKEPKTGLAVVPSIDLKLNASGSYYHLLSFLQSLEKSPRIIVVKSVNIQVGQKPEAPAANAATVVPGGTGSSNPPPSPPVAKGTRIQTSALPAVTAPVQTPPSVPTVPEINLYDTGNIQMSLAITTYHYAAQIDIDKLLNIYGAKQAGESNVLQDADPIKGAETVKKF
ncbi:MAG TPA: GspMb/PilO family protein [Syntrophomonas sp.]|nr:GspMb/PilO family protein [Syntrophomonas sp.]